MSLAKSFRAEIEHEFANTRKMLERVPFDKADWKPHEKSMSLKELSVHTAEIAGLGALILTQEELDFEKVPPRKEVKTREDLLAIHDEGVRQTLAALENSAADKFAADWVMRKGAHIIMKMPRAQFLRGMGMNHIYHHRGQLSVYLRLLDVPIPGMYGPSADDE